MFYYEIEDSNNSQEKEAIKRPKISDDDSWSYRNKKGQHKRRLPQSNKVAVNTYSKEKQINYQRVAEKNSDTRKVEPTFVDEPKFHFNQPEAKHNYDFMNSSPSPITFKRNASNHYQPRSFNQPETPSSSTEINQSSSFIPRSFAFSPTPFSVNRGPGVSPNMIPRFNPFTNSSDYIGRDYVNRNMSNSNTPNIIGQNVHMNINRNEPYSNRDNSFKTISANYPPQLSNVVQSPAMNPFGGYGMNGASPIGFTPVRTNFQKHSPIFSSVNPDYAQYFNTSPNMNNMSYQTFGYPKSQVQRPTQQSQNTTTNGNQQQQQKTGNYDDEIIDFVSNYI